MKAAPEIPTMILARRSHRPWPMPQRPWVMAQSWHDLLFMHWPISIDLLRPKIPDGLEIDTFDGQAWISVVPFFMTHVRPRYLMAMPGVSHFPELNVRTYVTDGQKPGVWFFSLDASRRIGVEIARNFYHLPYFMAKMQLEREDDIVRYISRRTDKRGGPGEFIGGYRPTGPFYHTKPDTLEHFLTSRYALYTTGRWGRLLRGEIHHVPWPLQPVEAEIKVNTVADMHGITLPDTPPLMQFVRRLDILAWALERVR